MNYKEETWFIRNLQLISTCIFLIIFMALGYNISLTDELLLIIAVGVWSER